MEVEIKKGSILEVEVDAIVNPANSQGIMGGGVAGVIRRSAGREVEEEAMKQSPIPVGKAVLTSAGNLPFKGIIHAPTMERPAMATNERKVKAAVNAAMSLADESGFKSLAIPGMGTGVGRVPREVAARVMMEAIRDFSPTSLQRIVLVDVDDEMVRQWKKAKRLLIRK